MRPEGDRPGVKVMAIEPDSPSAKAGLRPGDLLVYVDGKALLDSSDYVNALREYADKRTFGVLRAGTLLEVTVHYG